MPISWSAVEKALVVWVRDSLSLLDALAAPTGFPLPGNIPVIWADQNGQRPGQPFVTLRRDAGQALNPNEDELVVSMNPSPTTADEIQMDTRVVTEFTVSVQVFTKDTRGDFSANALASVIRNRLSMQSQLDAFRPLGLAVVARGSVQNLTDLLETGFEGRAVMDVRFRVTDGTTEFVGYIGTANVTESLTP
jgi:hypothetical protein